jgi:hypothetical protein
MWILFILLKDISITKTSASGGENTKFLLAFFRAFVRHGGLNLCILINRGAFVIDLFWLRFVWVRFFTDVSETQNHR